MKDYYALLGIKSDASNKEIKKNYRLLATKFHPDKNSQPDAAAKFTAITEAYDILSNRNSRTQYDLKRWEKLKEEQRSGDTFKTVVPPTVSLRTRRDIAQRKRSLKYHSAQSSTKKTIRLLIESIYIIGRYLVHILGLSLFSVILYSAINQIPNAFESGLGYSIPACVIIAFIVLGLFKIGQLIFTDFKSDLIAFANAYKIPKSKANLFSISILILVLLIYLAFLSMY